MIITAIYLFGIIQGAWNFTWWYGFWGVIVDTIFLYSIFSKEDGYLIKIEIDKNE